MQQGSNSDPYVDWRFRVGFDLTDDNLLYLLVATGNKAPSFNDTVDLDTGPGEEPVHAARRVRKRARCTRSDRRTRSTVGGNPLVLNASAYYVDYTDQVFSTLVGIQLLDNDPTNDIGCEDDNPTHPATASR